MRRSARAVLPYSGYHLIPVFICPLFFVAAMKFYSPWTRKSTPWMVLYTIMSSILFWSACLFCTFIGGCWYFGCLLNKSNQEEKLAKMFDLVSWKMCSLHCFLMQTLDSKNILLINLLPMLSMCMEVDQKLRVYYGFRSSGMSHCVISIWNLDW